MSVVTETIQTLAAVSSIVGSIMVIVCPLKNLMRGRFISRPVIRLLGLTPAWIARVLFSFGWSGMIFAILLDPKHHVSLAMSIVSLVWNAWLCDDYLFHDDDDDKRRRYEWAKIRLRMPKPVKLRAVERWGAAPA